MKLIYATTNYGKYTSLKELLSNFILIWFNYEKKYRVAENDNIFFNSKLKALKASPYFDNDIVFSSDDSLEISGLSEKDQPKADIYRTITANSRDENIISSYYMQLLKKLNKKIIKGKIITNYSFVKNKSIIDEFTYVNNISLKLPDGNSYIENLPLSKIHYIPKLNKYYPELNLMEKIVYHCKLIENFNKLINKINKEIDITKL